jgi:type III pantothenate kinase
MDINLLVLGAGNSRVAMGVFEAGELTYVTRIAHEQRSDWGGKIAAAWERVKGKDNASIAGASVNPVVMESLEHVVQETTGQRVEWVGRELDLPIKVRTEQPKETGVDRVLSVAAAYEQLGKACVVVDAGTAITVNLCNDAGEFLGGAIAPGAKMMLDALHEKTARLPQVEFAVPEGPFGRDTTEAMREGVYHSIRGLVKEVVENYATDIGSWPELIATGGDAATLFGGWELVHAISPDLVLYGIALAYANHHIRHGT